jgi:hypothetical protein
MHAICRKKLAFLVVGIQNFAKKKNEIGKKENKEVEYQRRSLDFMFLSVVATARLERL